jgi:hypothetical protein
MGPILFILATFLSFSDALYVEAVTMFKTAKPKMTKFYLRQRPRNFNNEEAAILIIRYLSIGEQMLLFFRFLKILFFTFLCTIRPAIFSRFVPQPRSLVASFPLRRSEFDPRSSHAWFVVDNVALRQGFSEYFCFLCQFTFRLFQTRPHLSSWAGTIGQIVADVTSGLSLTHSNKFKKTDH